MLKDYFSLAFRNLKQRGLRSWLTILGIFIGIAAVVSLISMGQGLQAAVTGQFGVLSFDKLTIQNKGTGFGPPGSTVVEKLNENDLEIIKSTRGVDKVIPRLIRIGSLEYNGVSGFGYGADIPEERELMNLVYETFSAEAEQGRLLETGDKGKVLLGNIFFDMDDFGKEFRVGKKIKLGGAIEKEFEIIGILEKSSNFQMNSVVFMMSNDMKELFDIEDEYDLIVAQVENKDNIENVAEEIKRKLRSDRNEKPGEETFSVETPLQALGAVNTILNIINTSTINILIIIK